ncbi:MAG: RsmE family RNA methyltransferase, partial [Planctomycetota bacterium]
MSRRCFSDKPITGPAITIDGGEAHHLLHVLRLSPGDGVTLFDGEGAQYDAEVFSCGRSTVELHVGEAHAVDRELPQLLTLACPLPKGDRQRWIVEKAVELGVTRLIPLQTDRSGSGGGVKLKRYVIEASKQCGRNRLMRIGPQLSWSNWLQFGSSDESGGDQKSR